MCESLPFHPYKGKDFKWTSNADKDDWTGTYTGINRTIMLRAEQMSTNDWWCCAYVNNEQVFDGSYRTEAGAKRAALTGLNKYLKQLLKSIK